jgi:hypothetical protein
VAIGDGTVTTVIITRGTYTPGGNNTNLGDDWKELTYQPEIFEVTLAKVNQPSFFTPGTRVANGDQVGPCTELDDRFNNGSVGCPCGGNWTVTPFTNGVSTATRTINKTSCMENGTSTCPENFWFSLAPRYGSFRVRNSTDNMARILEITRPLHNQSEGWNNSDVYANFTANHTCPARITGAAPTPGESPAFVLVPSAVVLGVLALW